MHKLTIHNLGPLDECEINCGQFMVLTGEQASGKSTIAKAVYYFRTVKDDIFEILKEKFLDKFNPPSVPVQNDKNKPLIKILRDILRKKFIRTFGYQVSELREGMRVSYRYTDEYSVTVRLINAKSSGRKMLHVEMSKPFTDFVNEYDKRSLILDYATMMKFQFSQIQAEINNAFNDAYEIIYIPSGRSMLTLFSNSIRFYPIFALGVNTQDSSADYCTQKYMEKQSDIKREFSGGLEGIIDYHITGSKIPQSWETAQKLIHRVLCGKYKVENGEERIILDDGKYVNISFASSGQQDTLWVTNLLFYYLVSSNPAMFIIEEPESHLFPSSQKYITELISLVCNQGHSVLVTTHSPYVLGTLNNLLYASSFSKNRKKNKAAKIIPPSLWIDYGKFQAWFVKGGKIEDCMSEELKQIKNELIDSISEVINDDYDKLFELNYTEESNAAE